ncbi:3-mercaptopyruvate sulfurtransferase SseA, contains two rhodanese domains [Thiomonas bhubaneswarensis]|uniref:3-mercaptopyruvate sulfurtransferase SseA, contains two rhodanese domains n=2 Tax=Thiomonas bhubaneswarensis TaxID=339866 RepID=A0A0K6HX20_9BURK|nr:3-mercaptopyruvate sulfurtransferase SseA, contains two rhodanese domains [Thiomonas bhubaneswarensis]
MPCMNTPTSTPSPSAHRIARRSVWSRLCRACALGWFLAAWALQQGVGAAPAHQAEAQTFGPLISATALAAQRAQVRIIDLRDMASEPHVAHIPGALPAPYADWRGPASNPGQLRPLAEFTALVRRLGLTAETPVVLVASGSDPSDFGAPARVYWTLKWLGLKHLAILNGGMTAWLAAGLSLTREPTPPAAPSAFTPQLDGALLATRAEVAQDLARPGTLLLDARPRAFYLGREKAPIARCPGTLPGALDFDNLRWFEQGSAALPDTATLERVAQTLPQPLAAAPSAEVVSFCNTGHWAATNWFVLSQVLHRPHVALYPGSMVDWSRADAPMAHVPTRLQQLWQQLEQTWQAL